MVDELIFGFASFGLFLEVDVCLLDCYISIANTIKLQKKSYTLFKYTVFHIYQLIKTFNLINRSVINFDEPKIIPHLFITKTLMTETIYTL